MKAAFLCACVVGLAVVSSAAAFEYSTAPEVNVDEVLSGIGNGLWHSVGFYDVLPTNASAAVAKGWYKQGDCVEGMGVLYAENKDGPSSTHPLELWFTEQGQFAGFQVTIYGSSSTSSIGNAAQPQLLQAGYWKPTSGKSKTWHMSVSTRAPEDMCSSALQSELLGTQLVINQDTIDVKIPLSARDAQAAGYAPGACIKGMGQHWEYDITLGNGSVSWVAGNLMPVVPMYNPPTMEGTIHAIFFTTPVAQPGALLFGHGDWDTPALTATLMCDNFCQANCHWNTHFWSTMHLYLNSDWKTAECPGDKERMCPKDTTTN